MRAVKIRAAMEGRKLKEVVAEALKAGLLITGSAARSSRGIRIEKDPATGLPAVVAVAQAPGSALTAEELKRLEQDALNQEDLLRAGLSL